MREETRTVYISYDDVEFEDKDECIAYENKWKHKEKENLIGCWFWNAIDEQRRKYMEFARLNNINGLLGEYTDDDFDTMLKWCRENEPK